MGYYNWRGTGNPAIFPYAVNEHTYITTPTFFWEKPRPPMRYSNSQFDAFYNGWSRVTCGKESRVDGPWNDCEAQFFGHQKNSILLP